MERVNYFFTAGLCFWAFALLAWCFDATHLAVLPGSLALIAFLLHILQQRVFTMFGKSKNPMAEPQNNIVVSPVSAPVEKETPREEKQNNTVISSEVRFEGNIIATGQVYIYGQVHGNIESNGGIIKIMRNGLVEGNITCRELIVDGMVIGECKSDSIDIYENGNINGAISYAALAIKKGGVFIGQSYTMPATPAVEKKTNVVDLSQEKPAAVPPTAQSLMAGDKPKAKNLS